LVRLTWTPSGKLAVSGLGQSPHLTFWAVFLTTVLTLLPATLVPQS
jgi:hypothetical protein